MSDNAYYHCTRCHKVPCLCTADHITDPAIKPIESERPAFEAFMRNHFPERSLERYGHTYADNKTRDRFIGWCGKVHYTDLKIVAKRA